MTREPLTYRNRDLGDAARALRLLAWVGVWSLCGCSLKDYGYLNSGSSAGTAGESHTGGVGATTTHSGGVEGGADSPGGGGGGALPDAGAGGADVGLDAGAGGAGEGGRAGAGGEGHATGGGPAAGQGGMEDSGGSTGTGGTVEPTCDSGLTPCSGECADLAQGRRSANTFVDCGACGTVCNTSGALNVACTDGQCVPECSPGFDDCNGPEKNDGCEADLNSASNCGECGRACSSVASTSVSCADGKCSPHCLPAFADCNDDATTALTDGCEVYLDALSDCRKTCEAGVSCGSTQVCNAGVCGDAQGLVVFSIPLTEAGQRQRYGDKFTPIDLTDTKVLIRAYAPGVEGGAMLIYPLDVDWTSGAGVTIPLSDLSGGWTDIELPIGSISGEFDPVGLQQVTLEIYANSTGPWSNPTVVYIDSIRSTNGRLDHTFDASFSPMVSSTSAFVEGSEMIWADSLAE